MEDSVPGRDDDGVGLGHEAHRIPVTNGPERADSMARHPLRPGPEIRFQGTAARYHEATGSPSRKDFERTEEEVPPFDSLEPADEKEAARGLHVGAAAQESFEGGRRC